MWHVELSQCRQIPAACGSSQSCAAGTVILASAMSIHTIDFALLVLL